MTQPDEATRKRHAAEKESARRLALAKLDRILAGTGMSAHCSTVMVDRDKDRVDIFPLVSMSLSQLLREDA